MTGQVIDATAVERRDGIDGLTAMARFVVSLTRTAISTSRLQVSCHPMAEHVEGVRVSVVHHEHPIAGWGLHVRVDSGAIRTTAVWVSGDSVQVVGPDHERLGRLPVLPYGMTGVAA